ncbi:Phytosulfokines 3 [Bienertia sinuspersici]
MSKVVSSFFTLILLTSMLSFNASRVGRSDQALQTQHRLRSSDEINCDEIEKDECLFRRSLAAHLDYIYTQKQQP